MIPCIQMMNRALHYLPFHLQLYKCWKVTKKVTMKETLLDDYSYKC